jgi:hypothetical protein
MRAQIELNNDNWKLVEEETDTWILAAIVLEWIEHLKVCGSSNESFLIVVRNLLLLIVLWI